MSDEEKALQEESVEQKDKASEAEAEIAGMPKRKFPTTLVVGLVLVLAVVGILGGRALLLNGGAGEEQVAANPYAYASTSGSQGSTAGQFNGSSSASSPESTASTLSSRCVVATVQDGVQYLTSSMDDDSYEPVSVQQNIPVKWTLNAPAGSLNSCNNAIHIPAWGVEMPLVEGDNIIEFIPDMSGTFQYSCWMDMIYSSVTVVGEDGTVADYTDIDYDALDAAADCC